MGSKQAWYESTLEMSPSQNFQKKYVEEGLTAADLASHYLSNRLPDSLKKKLSLAEKVEIRKQMEAEAKGIQRIPAVLMSTFSGNSFETSN